MEKDDEIKGSSGSSYDFGARMYDPRVGRWLAVDPKFYETPSWSTYTFVHDNPIYVIDPDGKSGVAYLDKTNKTVTIKSTIYFYGNASTPTLAKSTAQNIQNMWNAASGTININGTNYSVKFEVNGIYKTEDEVKLLAVGNTNSENNFIRIVDGTQWDKNKMKSSFNKVSGNDGVMLDYELGGTKSTDAHEFGHSLGWYEKGERDGGTRDAHINNGVPGIMTPRGIAVDDKYGYKGQAKGKATVNPAKRTVLASDISKLDINTSELLNKGRTNVGTATNELYGEDALPIQLKLNLQYPVWNLDRSNPLKPTPTL